ncbi:MAG: hypothetical protein NTW10_15335 [Bacteroidetes bacterium]|nr:hypothetical protein [Bacteroidota bacterium]
MFGCMQDGDKKLDAGCWMCVNRVGAGSEPAPFSVTNTLKFGTIE